MLNRRVLNYGAHLLPAIVILIAVPVVFSGYETVAHVTRVVLYLYMIILGLLMTTSFLDALHDLYQTRPAASEVPIKGFVEVIKIAFVFISIILAMSLLINQTPLYLFSGLGAMTAVLLLIFKDSILGFVAGIQLTSNRMVAIGDWIEMAPVWCRWRYHRCVAHDGQSTELGQNDHLVAYLCSGERVVQELAWNEGSRGQTDQAGDQHRCQYHTVL